MGGVTIPANYFAGGVTQLLLIDTSSLNGQSVIKFPAIGSQLLVSAGVGSGAGGGAPGPAGPPGTATPAAPNILSATIVAVPSPNGSAPPLIGLSGVITLPVADPNYSHDKQLNITASDPTGNQYPIGSILSSSWSGSTVAYVGIASASFPTSSQTWTLSFVALNEVGAPTSPPYTHTVTISPITLSVSAAEDTGSLRQDGSGNVIATLLETITTSFTGISATVWLDHDDGDGPQLQGSYALNSSTVVESDTIQIPISATETNWTIWAAIGTYTSNTPPSGAVSDSFTVTSVGTVTAVEIIDAIFLNDPDTGQLIDYPLGSDGLQTWLPYGLKWTQPTDSNVWYTFITAQKGHVASGVWVPATDAEGADEAPELYTGRMVYRTATVPTAGTAIITIPGSALSGIGNYPENSAADRTFRFLLYCVSSLGTDSGGGGAGTIVLQSTAFTGADHFDLTPDAQSATLDGGLLKAASVLALSLNVAAINAATGALVANAVVDGLCTLPVSQLIAGAAIFTGDVFLSRGSAYPILELKNDGVYLFGAAGSGGITGLTSQPYLAVQSAAIGIFAGATAASMTLTSNVLALWTKNGDVSYPYLQVQATGVSVVSGSSSMTIKSSMVKAAYSTTIYTSVNSGGVSIVNGTYSIQVGATNIALYSVDGNDGYPFMQLSSSTLQVVCLPFSVSVTAYNIFLQNETTHSSLELTATAMTISVPATGGGVNTLVANATSLTITSRTGDSIALTSSSGTTITIHSGTATMKLDSASFFTIVDTLSSFSLFMNDSGLSLSAPNYATSMSFSQLLMTYSLGSLSSQLVPGQFSLSSGSGSATLYTLESAGSVTVQDTATPTPNSLVISLTAGNYPTLKVNGLQVLTVRQTGVGYPTGWTTVGQALAWSQGLYNALALSAGVGHGLIS